MAKKRDARPGKQGGDDADLFRRAMVDAAPLPKRARIKPVDPPVPPSSPKPTQKPQKQTQKQSLKPAVRVLPNSGPAAHAAPTKPFAGIDRRNADRFRRGKLPIEARLDLHGRFQAEAHGALNRFIVNSAAGGRRVVLVITGKGRVSEGGGVLRRNVPEWLRMAPCVQHVLAASPAQPQHGGSGALYVMLKRKREK